jgi:hypothetical protein
MQFTINRTTRSGSIDVGLAIGSRQNHLMVYLFGFGASVTLWNRWWGFHKEGYRMGAQGAGGTVNLGPLEFTGQVPAWATLGSRSAAS